jgi:hypothetical protein
MTFEHDAVIATLAARASDQVKAGVKELHGGNVLAALVYLAAAQATLSSLAALLDGTAPAKPMRRLCVVGTAAAPHDPDLAPWMETTHGEPDDGAA